MRKGENTRRELLETAERLFCRNGFDETGISEVMAEMGLSKGGFYHHFAGKDALLAALCDLRAERTAQAIAAGAEDAENPVQRIDRLLNSYLPLRESELPFLRSFLPYLRNPSSRLMALNYQEAMVRHVSPLLEEAIAEARKAGEIYPETPDAAAPLLHLLNRCFFDVAACLPDDPASALPILKTYRRLAEVLLGAPFGSITLVTIDELAHIAQNLK